MQVAAGFDGHVYEHSSGYREAHSCETTLINLVEGWRKARDNKLAVSILSTDMSKAFDSLHPPLNVEPLFHKDREAYLACLGSQSQRRIWFILPAL